MSFKRFNSPSAVRCKRGTIHTALRMSLNRYDQRYFSRLLQAFWNNGFGASAFVTPIFLFLSLIGTPLVAASDLKIGFVNSARVMEEAPQALAASETLEVEFADRQSELERLRKSLAEMERQLETINGSRVTSSDKSRLQREISRRLRNINLSQAEFNEDLNIRRNEELKRLQRLVVTVLEEIAHDQRFDLILTDGVFFASDKVDITDRVIDHLKRLQGANY